MKIAPRFFSAPIAVLAALLPVHAHASYSLQAFGPSQYLGGTQANLNAMQVNLGLSGFEVEDFATLALPTGRLTFSGSALASVVAENGNSWGRTGTGFLGIFATVGSLATIQIAGGTSVIGIGFSALESGNSAATTSLSINGGTPIPLNSATLPSFAFSFTIRNGYLKVAAGAGDPLIQRVDLIQAGALDGYQIDYIATAPIPEPSERALMLFGMAIVIPVALALRRRARNVQQYTPGDA